MSFIQYLRSKFLLWGQTWIEQGDVRLLAPLSFCFCFAAYLRNAYYDRKEPTKIRRTVVSVGNIEVGGTGKTPLVLFLAETFRHKKVAILSRGYGPIPDEARLLAKRAPWTTVYVGKDRVQLARKAAQEGAELILLDDGMQHRRLGRDFELVTIGRNETRYLPWGRLRDLPARLKEADEVFSWGSEGHNIGLDLVVKRIVGAQGELPSLQGKEVGFFCAIARPERFRKTLQASGAIIKEEWILGDHQPVDLDLLEKFVDKMGLVITTEKDFVKLPTLNLPIYYLEMETRLISGEAKWKALIEKIGQKIDNYSTYE